MNWLTNFVKPKLSSLVKRKDVPERLWNNCLSCGSMIHHKDLKNNLRVCPNCNYHFRMGAEDRKNLLFNEGEYKEISLDKLTDDPLNFIDKKKYKERLRDYRNKTKRDDALILIEGKINEIEVISAIMNFEFMVGSMGRAVGGAIVKGAKIAVEKRVPYIVVTSSGGARMQEGIISLMQMPRTIAAVDLLNENGIPYIVILTEPTTGGVTASFAMLGDITIAEKGATIGFAGKRVIQDTIREELPIDFQKAEYLKDHGMVDIVSHRKDLKQTLYNILKHIN